MNVLSARFRWLYVLLIVCGVVFSAGCVAAGGRVIPSLSQGVGGPYFATILLSVACFVGVLAAVVGVLGLCGVVFRTVPLLYLSVFVGFWVAFFGSRSANGGPAAAVAGGCLVVAVLFAWVWFRAVDPDFFIGDFRRPWLLVVIAVILGVVSGSVLFDKGVWMNKEWPSSLSPDGRVVVSSPAVGEVKHTVNVFYTPSDSGSVKNAADFLAAQEAGRIPSDIAVRLVPDAAGDDAESREVLARMACGVESGVPAVDVFRSMASGELPLYEDCVNSGRFWWPVWGSVSNEGVGGLVVLDSSPVGKVSAEEFVDLLPEKEGK